MRGPKLFKCTACFFKNILASRTLVHSSGTFEQYFCTSRKLYRSLRSCRATCPFCGSKMSERMVTKCWSWLWRSHGLNRPATLTCNATRPTARPPVSLFSVWCRDGVVILNFLYAWWQELVTLSWKWRKVESRCGTRNIEDSNFGDKIVNCCDLSCNLGLEIFLMWLCGTEKDGISVHFWTCACVNIFLCLFSIQKNHDLQRWRFMTLPALAQVQTTRKAPKVTRVPPKASFHRRKHTTDASLKVYMELEEKRWLKQLEKNVLLFVYLFLYRNEQRLGN